MNKAADRTARKIPAERTCTGGRDVGGSAGLRAKQRVTGFRFMGVLACVAASLVVAGQTTAVAARAGRVSASPAPGSWSVLGPTTETKARPTFLQLPSGRTLAVWHKDTGSSATLEYAQLGQYGGIAVGAKDMFPTHHWPIVTGDPRLVTYQGAPLLLFSGQQNTIAKNPLSEGCIIGSVYKGSTWTIQKWSLTHDCIGANAGYGDGEAMSSKGVLSAAWPSPGNEDLNYHIGISPQIPAPGGDHSIPLSNGEVLYVNEAADTGGSDHFYAAWYRRFSKPAAKDGLYAADVSGKAVPVKAPASGPLMAENIAEDAAMANSTQHGGVYLAYCTNDMTCKHLDLWRVGAKKPEAVPRSKNATVVSMSSGTDGRLWLAWYNSTQNRVSTVRTNKADNYFGPVESYNVRGCSNDDNARVAISGGASQRLDVVVACVGTSGTTVNAHLTQSLTGLGIGASKASIQHKKGGSVTFTVTDAGDAVPGALVKGDNRSGTTNASGRITFIFPKNANAGTFRFSASKANYFGAATTLRIQ